MDFYSISPLGCLHSSCLLNYLQRYDVGREGGACSNKWVAIHSHVCGNAGRTACLYAMLSVCSLIKWSSSILYLRTPLKFMGNEVFRIKQVIDVYPCFSKSNCFYSVKVLEISNITKFLNKFSTFLSFEVLYSRLLWDRYIQTLNINLI